MPRLSLLFVVLVALSPSVTVAQDAVDPAAPETGGERDTGTATATATATGTDTGTDTDTDTGTDTGTDTESLRAENRPRVDVGERAQVAVGLSGGFGFNVDQWVAGPRVEVRGIGVEVLEVEATVLAGIAAEHVTLRAAAHARLVLEVSRWRFYPMFGAALFAYEPRGQFGEWCDKLDMDCNDVGVGLEAGLGVGWRGLSVEAYYGTGDLPFITLLGSAAVVFE